MDLVGAKGVVVHSCMHIYLFIERPSKNWSLWYKERHERERNDKGG